MDERALPSHLLNKMVVADSGCWLWTASVRPSGYGQIWTRTVEGRRRLLSAHRAVWEAARGPVPDGLDLDHLCRVRTCVNPDHLEPVTRKTNILRGLAPAAANARKTVCDKGHQLQLLPTGRRGCPKCKRAYLAERRSNDRRPAHAR